MAPIMYHSIHCAAKSAISGIESKDHRMDIHGQLHKAGGTELIQSSSVAIGVQLCLLSRQSQTHPQQ